VAVFGRINHLGTEPGTQAPGTCGRIDEYLAKAGEVNRHIAWYTSPYPCIAVFADCLAEWVG